MDTTGAMMLHETGLLPRWYLPEADVAPGLLRPSDTRTSCPFKGEARYWHLEVDARRSSRHVVVRVGGEVVAETRSPVAVVETGMPVRWYVPGADVRDGVLDVSETTSVCPYKGVATYGHVVVGGRRYEDAAWCYREPLLEALPAAGHRSFDGEDVEVQVSA